MNPTSAYKDKIGLRLSRRMLHAFEDGEITEEELKDISSYILENIDKAQNNAELYEFLEAISAKWPIFQDVLIVENAETGEKKKGEVIEKVEDLIEQNKIDQALQVASQANDQIAGGKE
jgi:hypothetical protein